MKKIITTFFLFTALVGNSQLKTNKETTAFVNNNGALHIVPNIINAEYVTRNEVTTKIPNENIPDQLFWINNENAPADTHAAFRGVFSLDKTTNLELQITGASWYVIWLDGKYFYEGPDRYTPEFPEYQKKQMTIGSGKHCIAIQVHYEGVNTRILKAIQPFLYCKILSDKQEVSIDWKCTQLKGYLSNFKLINKQLGWVEWVDTRQLQFSWQELNFKDTGWVTPKIVNRKLGAFTASKISNLTSTEIMPKQIASGMLAEMYGYEKDNISARFFLRDLECKKVPAQGIWRRYDVGRVRVCRPKFVLDLPKGAVVEFAYSEQLQHGRVSPWITLSSSDSYNLDHFVARGGKQEFFPLTPKGGRYMEMHILAPIDQIHVVSEIVLDRCYYDQVQGSFMTNDSLLNKIWKVGVNTYLSCAEDALIDNPTRERGQWLGDVGIVGMEIGSAGFSDLKIIRRGLVQSAQCARQDGMVAGLCPGGNSYLSSYAAQWVPACLNYWRKTGDKSILEELYPAAEKNMEAFSKFLGKDGIDKGAGWAFIDWGYIANNGPTDMGMNLHYYSALQSMEKWAQTIGKTNDVIKYHQLTQKCSDIITAYFNTNKTTSGYDFEQIGYHRTVLGIITGFIPMEYQKQAVSFIKKHILNCFPNNPDAPRLSGTRANNAQLITPYFAHYAFPLLIKNGEIDFVLDQYRKCWGWALEDDRTTWLEVFDTRWSHCHQWSGCPTWQLSHYVLGLESRFDIQKNCFDFDLKTGSLEKAEGDIPLPSGNTVHIKWRKSSGNIYYEVSTKEPITINISKESLASKKGVFEVNNTISFKMPLSNSVGK